jgi:hypothetical protein
MPTKIKKLVCLFVVNISFATSAMSVLANTQANTKATGQNAFNYTKTLSSKDLFAGIQQAGIALATACIEFDNYEEICTYIQEITTLTQEYAADSALVKNQQLQNNQAKAKFFQLTALMAENRNSRRVNEIGNFYRFAAGVFHWQQSDWKRILVKYRQLCFNNYIKNSVEIPFTRFAKILGGFLVCIKLVDFLKDPGKTFGSKKKNNLEDLTTKISKLEQLLEQCKGAQSNERKTSGVGCH